MINIKRTLCMCMCSLLNFRSFFYKFSTQNFIFLTSHTPHEDIWKNFFFFAPFSHHWQPHTHLRARMRKKIYLLHKFKLFHSLFSIIFRSFLTFLVFFTNTFRHSPFDFLSHFLFFTATTREKNDFFFSFQCEHDTNAEIYVKRMKAEPIMNDFFMCVAQLLFSVFAKCGSIRSFSCEKCGKFRWEKIDKRKFKIQKMKILWIIQIFHEWSCMHFRMNF